MYALFKQMYALFKQTNKAVLAVFITILNHLRVFFSLP